MPIKLDRVADLKRAIQPGMFITIIATNRYHKYLGVLRTVYTADSVGFSCVPYTTDDQAKPIASYLDWPKAAYYTPSGDNRFKVTYPDGLYLEYELKTSQE